MLTHYSGRLTASSVMVVQDNHLRAEYFRHGGAWPIRAAERSPASRNHRQPDFKGLFAHSGPASEGNALSS